MIINMFSFSFAVVVFIVLGVNGQNNNFNTFPSNNQEKASLFGQFHHLIDNQNQEQPTPVSCFRVRANIKNAYLTDNTKYFVCRDEQRYEIFTCPNGGIFDDREKVCIDLCEQNKPCLHQGQCIILANLTLQCVCRRDWTGERCEIPLSTCTNNPCGPNAECRMLVASDYPQDYVCICNDQQTYGRNCQQTVPNPCLMNIQQFHPFAFSRRAYINCDDEMIFFQPCNAKLYWNQEDKRCDRALPLLLRAPFINIRQRNEQKQQVQPNIVQPTQWQNQIADNPTPTDQRFAIQSQPWQGSRSMQNHQFPSNTFMETTTTVPRIFHLKGFSNHNYGQQNIPWQNNGNNQIQSSGGFNTQPITQSQSGQDSPSIDQNQQITTTETTPQVQMPFQQNNQFGFNQQFQAENGQSTDLMAVVQSQPGQWTTSSFETTTVPNKDTRQGIFVHTLRGWQSNQQESLNQQNNLNSIPPRS